MEDEAIEMEKIKRIQKAYCIVIIIIIVNDSRSVFRSLSTGLSDDFGGNICN